MITQKYLRTQIMKEIEEIENEMDFIKALLETFNISYKEYYYYKDKLMRRLMRLKALI